MKKILYTFTVFLGVILFTGCTANVRVSSSYISGESDNAATPKIDSSKAYRDLDTEDLTVAIRPPESCLSRTAEERGGNAKSSETIMNVECGMEMAEMERALTRAGLSVISWKTFEPLIEEKESVRDAAAELEIDVIFQINSLENSAKDTGQEARWERIFYKEGAPFALKSADREFLSKKFVVQNEEKKLPEVGVFSVTIDITALKMPTGQGIWYYNWSKNSGNDGDNQKFYTDLVCKKKFLFFGPDIQTCTLAPQKEKKEALSAGDSVAITRSNNNTDESKAKYTKLYYIVSDNFAKSFANKTN